jgi:hypothetical protein
VMNFFHIFFKIKFLNILEKYSSATAGFNSR